MSAYSGAFYCNDSLPLHLYRVRERCVYLNASSYTIFFIFASVVFDISATVIIYCVCFWCCIVQFVTSTFEISLVWSFRISMVFSMTNWLKLFRRFRFVHVLNQYFYNNSIEHMPEMLISHIFFLVSSRIDGAI